MTPVVGQVAGNEMANLSAKRAPTFIPPSETTFPPFQILRESITPVMRPELNQTYKVDRSHVKGGLPENGTTLNQSIAKEISEKISQTLKQLRLRLLVTLIQESAQSNTDLSPFICYYYIKAIGEDLGIDRAPWEQYNHPFGRHEMKDADKGMLIHRFYELYTPEKIHSELYATFNGRESDLTAISPLSSLLWFSPPKAFIDKKRKEFFDQIEEKENDHRKSLQHFNKWIEDSKYHGLVDSLLTILNRLNTQTVSELLTSISAEQKIMIFDCFLLAEDQKVNLPKILQAIQTHLKDLVDPRNAGVPPFIEEILQRKNVPESERGPIKAALKGCFSCHHALNLLNMMRQTCGNPSMVRDWCSEYLFGEGISARGIEKNPRTLRQEAVEDCLVQLGVLVPIRGALS